MNTRFTFKPVDVIWLDELPTAPTSKTPTGRTMLFVEACKQRPGKWGKYPLIYKRGPNSALWLMRKNYPQLEWDSRDGFLYGRYMP